MGTTKFTGENREAILRRVADGSSAGDAAAAVGVSRRTVEEWLRKGRKDPDGTYGEFAAEYDRRREQYESAKSLALTDEEHRSLVSNACRSGSVTALKLFWEMREAERKRENDDDEPADPLDQIEAEAADELAAARAKKQHAGK